ncbi:NCS2 family permease [Inmirania thermothiophila]|uniref:AGZA family xanthine/uracil permease-like MFS transporter n=1 Tax=Inmirania thermothiophila TaxID=1750597 RepID=A0A3N1Y5T6_9GAMM|nr:NCS2 family permease [Inmirania thermothiophila]ROR32657.1 AGZA family xanthine/uracil permease-like MFS transporter [Inmirania thermothiophila]
METLERLFQIRARGSSVGTEIRAGVTTFLTMAYILFVNPQILSATGMPAADVAAATALASALATLVMGLWANFPFALAPGMGLNAYFTFGVVQGMGVPWPVALTAVFVEGLLFMLLAASGARARVIDAIPREIKIATMTGIGLFLAIIGFENAGLTVDHPATLVTLGDLHQPKVLLALAGVLLMGALLARGVRGAVLIGIVVLTLAAWAAGLAPAPQRLVAPPALPRETLLAMDLSQVFRASLLPVILAFLFVDFFDTAGTLLGVGRLGGFLDREGRLPGAGRAFFADAAGTTVGALLGTSTVTTYIESATGVEEGGRTGLTAVVVALLFLAALFLTPLFTAVPALATAPALIVVGALMMRGAAELDWTRMEQAVPAFLTIVAMPFTYSIATGITAGVVSWVAVQLLAGRARTIHPVMGTLAAALVLYHALAGGA